MPIPVAARSKAWVCGSWLAEIAGSNPAGGMDVCLLRMSSIVGRGLCDGLSLFQRSPTECGVSECDCESSK